MLLSLSDMKIINTNHIVSFSSKGEYQQNTNKLIGYLVSINMLNSTSIDTLLSIEKYDKFIAVLNIRSL